MEITNQVRQITESSLDQRVDELAQDKTEAAEKFESLLATLLVKEFRKTLGDGLFGGGAGSDIYAGWFDTHVGEALARDGGFDMEGLIRVGIETKIESIENEGGTR